MELVQAVGVRVATRRVGGGARMGLGAVAAAGVVGMVCGVAQGQWEAGAWRAQRLGFFDAVHTRGDGQQQALIMGDRLERDGMVVGISERYGGFEGEDFVGASGWVSTKSRLVERVGFFEDDVHTSFFGKENTRIGREVALATSRRGAVNAAGQFVGYSTRYFGDVPVGRSAFVWDPALGTVRVGPRTGVFVGPDGLQSSTPVAFDSSGRVVGYSTRYDVNSAVVLSDVPPVSAWIGGVAGSEQLIGLINPLHTRPRDGYQRHEPRGMNDSGLVVGISYRFDTTNDNAPGQSAWAWTQATGTRRIGPTGTRYVGDDGTQYAYVLPPRASGDIAGASWTFQPGAIEIGRDAWVIPSGQTQPALLGFTDAVHTGFAGTQRSEPTVLWYDGGLRVGGYSVRYNPDFGYTEGRSAWSWSPSEGLIDIGLKDAEHTTDRGQRDSVPFLGMANGGFVGFAERFSGSSSRTGQSIWVWTPPTASEPQGRTVRLGLFDAIHTSAQGFQRSEAYGASASGIVVGVSYRYNGRDDGDVAVGRTAWVYDVNSGLQTVLSYSVSATGDSVTLPLTVGEDGVVNGYYLEYDGSEIVAQRAFVWKRELGGSTVNGLLAGGPVENDLENAFFGNGVDSALGTGTFYGMSPGVIWNVTGIGSWATGYRIDRVAGCDSLDFNNDGNIDPGDVDAYFSVLGEGGCLGGVECNDLDFNNDGNIDPSDVDAYFSILGEGPCVR